MMLLLGAALLRSGCAALTRGTNDVLIVRSDPRGAQVRLINGETCAAKPCTFKLPRKSEPNVLVRKQGCRPRQIGVTNRAVAA